MVQNQFIQPLGKVEVKENPDTEIPVEAISFTPGTPFMSRLSKYFTFFLRMKIQEDERWRKFKVYYSGPEVPGEGEHKIMDFIREYQRSPSYEPNLVHCMYGMDADLIMLGLSTHESRFQVFRESANFGKGSRERSQSGTKVKKWNRNRSQVTFESHSSSPFFYTRHTLTTSIIC